MTVPIRYRWTGEGWVPWRRFAAECDRLFAIGEDRTLEAYDERSDKTHRHEFAWLREAWQTLPDDLKDEHPSPEYLRKWALVKCGFYNEERIDVGTNAGALRVAQAIRSFPGEEFSAVVVRGPLVVVRRPKSQAKGKMDKAEFQASKTAILELIAELIGVTTEQLSKARAA